MSKIFNYYKDDVDHVWYQSSNIKYSECIDHDNELKTLKVVFNNGAQYKYNNVDVNQYLLFREDASQGKALNKYIKGNQYPYEKIEDADLQKLEDELNFRLEKGFFIHLGDESSSIESYDGKTVFSCNERIPQIGVDAVIGVLSSLGHEIKTLN